jgi:hypothetical protein
MNKVRVGGIVSVTNLTLLFLGQHHSGRLKYSGKMHSFLSENIIIFEILICLFLNITRYS